MYKLTVETAGHKPVKEVFDEYRQLTDSRLTTKWEQLCNASQGNFDDTGRFTHGMSLTIYFHIIVYVRLYTKRMQYKQYNSIRLIKKSDYWIQ